MPAKFGNKVVTGMQYGNKPVTAAWVWNGSWNKVWSSFTGTTVTLSVNTSGIPQSQWFAVPWDGTDGDPIVADAVVISRSQNAIITAELKGNNGDDPYRQWRITVDGVAVATVNAMDGWGRITVPVALREGAMVRAESYSSNPDGFRRAVLDTPNYGTTMSVEFVSVYLPPAFTPMGMRLGSNENFSSNPRKIAGMVAESAYPGTVVTNDGLVVATAGAATITAGIQFAGTLGIYPTRMEVVRNGNTLDSWQQGGDSGRMDGTVNNVQLEVGDRLELWGGNPYMGTAVAGPNTFLRFDPA